MTISQSTEDYYGRGPAYPLRLGPTGGVVEAAGIERIEQSVRIILGTQHGERVMRPDFGANLRSLAFAPNSPATTNLARHLVASALTRWEPRIALEDIEVENLPEQGVLVISIAYRIAGTSTARSLVVPVTIGGAT